MNSDKINDNDTKDDTTEGIQATKSLCSADSDRIESYNEVKNQQNDSVKSWVSMGIYGHLWASMGIYGYLRASTGIYGRLWTFMGIYGHLWPSMGIFLTTLGQQLFYSFEQSLTMKNVHL